MLYMVMKTNMTMKKKTNRLKKPNILLDQRQVVRKSLEANLLQISISISHSVGDIDAGFDE